MLRRNSAGRALPFALGLLLVATAASAQDVGKAQPSREGPKIEPKAVELLKAMSGRLASARAIAFTALATEESPSVYGAPLAYTTTSEVLLKRPDKLRVITAADGPASEFYYDGKRMVSFHPAENLAAIADAPPTLDAMLKKLYHDAGTYYPFTDLIVADPYGDVAPGLTLAFYVGRSKVVGGTTTDIVAYESEGVFMQIWLGAEDKLPRLIRAVFYDDPRQLRHQVELSHWQLEPAIAPEAFTSSKAKDAIPIKFAHPKTQSKRPPKPQ